MIVTLIDVSPVQELKNKNGKPYKSLEVTYKDEAGKASNKKLMDFNAPEVFAFFAKSTKGNVVEITTVKEGDYWIWKNAELSTASSAKQTSAPSTSSSGTYETRDERIARQRLIVRQSSLSNAIETLKETKGVSIDKVLALAEEFTNWVFEKGQVGLDNMESDIPE